MALAAFTFLAVLLSIISSVYGFGTALFLLAFGAFILPVKQAIALATILFASATLTKCWIFRREIHWSLAIKITLISTPMAYLGALLLEITPAEPLSRALGLLILSYVILRWSGWQPNLKANTPLAYPFAGVYGLLSGWLGSGHVVKVMLFQSIGINKGAFVGLMAATAIFNNLVKLVAYADQGLFSWQDSWAMVILLIGGAATALIGRKLVLKISDAHFEWASRILLGLAGGALVAGV